VKVLESTKELTKFMVSTGSTTLRPSYLAGRSLQGHVSAAVQEDWQVDSNKKNTLWKKPICFSFPPEKSLLTLMLAAWLQI
jgi:hypothetical protein